MDVSEWANTENTYTMIWSEHFYSESSLQLLLLFILKSPPKGKKIEQYLSFWLLIKYFKKHYDE